MAGKHSWMRLFLWFAAVVSAAGCPSSHNGPSAGSKTNWLSCASDQDCDEARSCLCGTCTTSCESNTECKDLDPGAICHSTETGVVEQLCGEAPEVEHICVLPCMRDEDCDEQATDMSCMDEVCIADALYRWLADGAIPWTDGGGDSSVDSGADSSSGARSDSSVSSGADSSTDARSDSSTDATVDSSTDATVDSSTDAGVDSSTDAAADSSVDAKAPQAVDGGPDAPVDAPPAPGALGGACRAVDLDEDGSVGVECDGELVCGASDLCEPACDELGRCLLDGLPRGRTLLAMLDDGESVYLRYAMTTDALGNPNHDGAIWKAKPGEHPQGLLESLSESTGFVAVDDAYLYFVEQDALHRIEKDGGPSEEVFPPDTLQGHKVVLIDGFFYRYDTETLVVSRASAAPGASFESFHTLDTSSVCGWWEGSSSAVWSDNGVLIIQDPEACISWDLRETGSQPLCAMDVYAMYDPDVQVDGQFIYWTDDIDAVARRMPRGGGESVNLVRVSDSVDLEGALFSIRLAGNWLYWYEAVAEPLTMHRAPLDPGPSESVLTLQAALADPPWNHRDGGLWTVLPTAVVWVYEGLVYFSTEAVQ